MENQNNNNEKVYSQSQVDDITNSVRNTEQKKYMELEKELSEYKSYTKTLTSNYDKLAEQTKQLVYDSSKQKFISNGGNPTAFDDFYNLNKDNFNNINWEETKNLKPHFFHTQSNEVDSEWFKDAKKSGTENTVDFGEIRQELMNTSKN